MIRVSQLCTSLRPLTHAPEPAPESGAIGLHSTPDSGASFSCRCMINVIDCLRLLKPVNDVTSRASSNPWRRFLEPVSGVCHGPNDVSMAVQPVSLPKTNNLIFRQTFILYLCLQSCSFDCIISWSSQSAQLLMCYLTRPSYFHYLSVTFLFKCFSNFFSKSFVKIKILCHNFTCVNSILRYYR